MVYDKNKTYIIGIIALCVIASGIFYLNSNNNSEMYSIRGTQGGSSVMEHTNMDEIRESIGMTYLLSDVNTDTMSLVQATSCIGTVVEVFRVHISGEVQNPGVYELEEGSRVVDLLELAGGSTEYADLNRINLAAFLNDAQQIIIPREGDYTVIQVQNIDSSNNNNSATGSGDVNSSLVNINTASAHELMSLPGIGTVLSQNIINHRETHGNFNSIQEIQRVNRIGHATFENIRSLITV